MKKTLLLALLLSPAAAAAQFRPFNRPPGADEAPKINFCASGKFVLFAGSCEASGKYKDAISPKACGDVAQYLYDGLAYLYPNAQVEFHQDLSRDAVLDKLLRPMILGFAFVGEGDRKGGFLTGGGPERVYPNLSVCQGGAVDFFAGFTSHSKYSPDAPARKADTENVLSRMELLYGGAGAAPGSWAALCKPRVAMVYPTRTFAGRAKDDVKKLFSALQEEKKKHVLKTLNVICDNCDGHVRSGGPLAQLCPPNSNVCRQRKIVPGSEELILKNYCSALAPTAARAQ